jgi:hypothetical protein
MATVARRRAVERLVKPTATRRGNHADRRASTVLYAGVGPELTLYSVDVDNAALVKK